MLFNIKMEMPIYAESFEQAAEIFHGWLGDSNDPLTPVIDVDLLDDDGFTIDTKQIDLAENYGNFEENES